MQNPLFANFELVLFDFQQKTLFYDQFEEEMSEINEN